MRGDIQAEALPPGADKANLGGNGLEKTKSGTFEHFYCRQTGCPPGEYQENVFWRCLHYQITQPLVRLIFLIRPKVFNLDLQLIDMIGSERNVNTLRHTVMTFDGFDRPHPDNNFLRKWLRLRISRRKLIALAQVTFSESK